jgi:hypothetical protein
MLSAVVSATSIVITYNEPVSCPTTAADVSAFVYDWTTSTSGGAATSGGCTTSGAVLTLAGSFILPSGISGSLVYTQVAGPPAGAVFATANPANAATTPQTIAGAAVS